VSVDVVPTETPQELKDRERYTALAERLYAAWLSQRMSIGVDYALKTYVRGQGPLGQLWIQFAKLISEAMSEAMNDMITQKDAP
jgi:hypothetical protein